MQTLLPNLNKDFLKKDHKKFTNVFDFSQLDFTDKKIIDLSKIANEKYF
jgi:hypothetical protein